MEKVVRETEIERGENEKWIELLERERGRERERR
jgi:hypothetical protein